MNPARASSRTVFTAILEHLLERTPGARGVIFADREGEAVDQVGTFKKEELLLYGAHFGVLLNLVQSALHLFHFGEALELLLQVERMDVVVRPVRDGYYLILCAGEDAHLATARREVESAAHALQQEM